MPITTNEAVTSEIRAEMARQQRRQTELMEVLGVSQASVSARLTGKVELTITEVVAIAAWLGVDPSRWFSFEVAS